MEHWKRKQMRLNYRWDLTGFEEEEVSGWCPSRPLPCPASHDLLGVSEEAPGPDAQARLLPLHLPRFTALVVDSPTVTKATLCCLWECFRPPGAQGQAARPRSPGWLTTLTSSNPGEAGWVWEGVTTVTEAGFPKAAGGLCPGRQSHVLQSQGQGMTGNWSRAFPNRGRTRRPRRGLVRTQGPPDGSEPSPQGSWPCRPGTSGNEDSARSQPHRVAL